MSLAALTFGKFQDAFLQEIHSEISSFSRQEEAGHYVQAPEGITVTESDILPPDPIRQGGLVRPNEVRPLLLWHQLDLPTVRINRSPSIVTSNTPSNNLQERLYLDWIDWL